MRKVFFSILFLSALLSARELCSQEARDLSKCCDTVSASYPIPDKDQQNFGDIVFRFGWNKKAPFKVAVQFVNRGYDNKKLKFAIKDVTSKKMVVLDVAHKSRFGSELLKSNSLGAVWSGVVDDVNDGFSLYVWNGKGEKFVKGPISIHDQE